MEKSEAYLEESKTVIATQTLRYNARGEVEKSLAPFEAAGLDTYSPNHPTGAGTTFTYDALGRLLRQTNPDNTSRSTSYPGFLTTLIDEAGNQRITVQDAYGRTSSEWLYEGQGGAAILKLKRSYTYDGLQDTGVVGLGSMERHTVTLDDNSNTTLALFYDRLGRKRLSKDPDSGGVSGP
ncbi:MAG: hypothetical protein HYY20_04675, partial [Candidatus Tectomicrobia bacterium]|nr:hypothetical protein [Candidatus Tectomicrobia bacterium]